MRHTEIGAVDLHALGIAKEAGNEASRKFKDLRFDAVAIEADGSSHRTEYSIYAISGRRRRWRALNISDFSPWPPGGRQAEAVPYNARQALR